MQMQCYITYQCNSKNKLTILIHAIPYQHFMGHDENSDSNSESDSEPELPKLLVSKELTHKCGEPLDVRGMHELQCMPNK